MLRVVVPCVVLVVTACATDDKRAIHVAADAHAESTPVVIDGHGDDDWADTSLATLDGMRAWLGIRNDAHNLYVLIVSSDPRQARALERAGFNLWIDGAATSTKGTGLYLPPMSGTVEIDPHRFVAPGEVTLVRDGHDERTLPSTGTDELALAAGVEDGKYAYELRVPLALFKIVPGQRISVGVDGEGIGGGPLHREGGGGRGMGRRGRMAPPADKPAPAKDDSPASKHVLTWTPVTLDPL